MKILFSRYILIFIALFFLNTAIMAEQIKEDKQLKIKINQKKDHIKDKNYIKSNVETKNKINEIIDKIDKQIKDNTFYNELNRQKNTDQLNSNVNYIQKKDSSNNISMETYAGMVGDKRINNGITLDLTMETKNIGLWLLTINGKNISNSNLINAYIQKETGRFFIDVNTNLIKDKTINFTYQMPKEMRLKYGEQENGYRIAIDLPKDTKIINKHILQNNMIIKFVNQNIIEEYDIKNIKTNNVKNNIVDDEDIEKYQNINKYKDDETLYKISKSATFKKIKLNHKKPFVIAIDAGHGGIDSGAIGSKGIHEKTITLKYAKSLRDELKKYNFNVIMTRDKDKTVSFIDRVTKAQAEKVDLFISLHTDAHDDPKISGTTVYRLTHISEEHPDWSRFYKYAPEKYKNYVTNTSILDILVGMTHQTLLERSSIMVDNVLLSLKNNNICRICRYGQRSFAVLRGLEMMSILIEIGYISNKKEEEKLLLESNIKKFSKILAETINNTFEEE